MGIHAQDAAPVIAEAADIKTEKRKRARVKDRREKKLRITNEELGIDGRKNYKVIFLSFNERRATSGERRRN